MPLRERGVAFAARGKKRGRQPEKKKDCPHSQSQWNMRWPHNPKIWLAVAWSDNRNHWQVDNFFHNTTFESWCLPASTWSRITWLCDTQIPRRFKLMRTVKTLLAKADMRGFRRWAITEVANASELTVSSNFVPGSWTSAAPVKLACHKRTKYFVFVH